MCGSLLSGLKGTHQLSLSFSNIHMSEENTSANNNIGNREYARLSRAISHLASVAYGEVVLLEVDYIN